MLKVLLCTKGKINKIQTVRVNADTGEYSNDCVNRTYAGQASIKTRQVESL